MPPRARPSPLRWSQERAPSSSWAWPGCSWTSPLPSASGPWTCWPRRALFPRQGGALRLGALLCGRGARAGPAQPERSRGPRGRAQDARGRAGPHELRRRRGAGRPQRRGPSRPVVEGHVVLEEHPTIPEVVDAPTPPTARDLEGLSAEARRAMAASVVLFGRGSFRQWGSSGVHGRRRHVSPRWGAVRPRRRARQRERGGGLKDLRHRRDVELSTSRGS
jgi:hypothetical protein